MGRRSCADSPCGRITLIGTVHRRGSETDLLLERLSPDIITLELSPWALHWRLSEGPRLLRRLDRILDRIASFDHIDHIDREALDLHPEVVGIRALLAFPAEFRAAAAWGGGRRIPLHPIDISAISARKLQRVEKELVTFRNVRTLISLGGADSGGEGYAAARRFVEGNPGPEISRAFLARRRGEEGIGVRDRWMARAIRRRILNHPEIHLVHLGGWVHLVEDELGETLFSRLRDLLPQRILAGDRR